jgi:hypothetical protein
MRNIFGTSEVAGGIELKFKLSCSSLLPHVQEELLHFASLGYQLAGQKLVLDVDRSRALANLAAERRSSHGKPSFASPSESTSRVRLSMSQPMMVIDFSACNIELRRAPKQSATSLKKAKRPAWASCHMLAPGRSIRIAHRLPNSGAFDADLRQTTSCEHF